jgi:hypothetical protein
VLSFSDFSLLSGFCLHRFGSAISFPRFGDSYRCLRNKHPSKPHEVTGLGANYVTKPYEVIGFGAMDVTKPYEVIGFVAMDVQFVSSILGSRRPAGQLDLPARGARSAPTGGEVNLPRPGHRSPRRQPATRDRSSSTSSWPIDFAVFLIDLGAPLQHVTVLFLRAGNLVQGWLSSQRVSFYPFISTLARPFLRALGRSISLCF